MYLKRYLYLFTASLFHWVLCFLIDVKEIFAVTNAENISSHSVICLFIYGAYWLRRLRRRQWHPTPVLLPRKSHGRRSLVGCSHGITKSRTQLSDLTFPFHFHALEKEMATHSSVLAWRIPGTGGDRWAAIYAVTQSHTQLKRLSSSSNRLRRLSCILAFCCHNRNQRWGRLHRNVSCVTDFTIWY